MYTGCTFSFTDNKIHATITRDGENYRINVQRKNVGVSFMLDQIEMDRIHAASGYFASDCVKSEKGLSFREAWFQLLNGKKIKLPSWEGYWIWENNTIMMHCKDGKILDIRETDNPAFTFSNVASDEWQVME